MHDCIAGTDGQTDARYCQPGGGGGGYDTLVSEKGELI